jgi:phage tail-like protein
VRGTVVGLRSPHPISGVLPALYAEDDLAQRFTGALDEVLAPIVSTLDCLDAYFDPALAPADFVDWLAGWVALPLDESWTLDQRRALVAAAVDLHRRRGTPSGLAELVALATGGRVEILESGGCVASELPGGRLPGTSRPGLHVRVWVRDPRRVDQLRLSNLVGEHKPAHLPHTVEILAEKG